MCGAESWGKQERASSTQGKSLLNTGSSECRGLRQEPIGHVEEEGGRRGCEGSHTHCGQYKVRQQDVGKNTPALGGHGEVLFFSWYDGKPWKVLSMRLLLFRICFNSNI